MVRVGTGIFRPEAKGDIAAKEGRIGKHQPRIHTAGAALHRYVQTLAPAQKVWLGKAQIGAKAVRHAKSQSKADRTRRLLGHRDLDHGLTRRIAVCRIHRDIGKEAQRPDAFGGAAYLRRVQGIALDRGELAAHHRIERGGVAFDINPLHEHPLAAHDGKGHVQRAIPVVARDARIDADKVQPLGNRQIFHRGRVVVDHGRRIGNAAAQPADLVKLCRINPLHFRDRRNLADLEAAAFLDREGQKGRLTVPRIFGGGVQDLEVDIAARQIEIRQQLFIQRQTCGVKTVALDQRVQDARLFGPQDLAQAVIAEIAVADKVQPLNLGDGTFGDLEHQIDAVVGQADDARRDGGVDPALDAVGLGDSRRVQFGLRRRIDQPGPGFGHGNQRRVVQRLVALIIHLVQHRQFHHPDQQCAALRQQFDLFEQARADDALVDVVQRRRRYRLALGKLGIGQDRCLIDAGITLDLHCGEVVTLRLPPGGRQRQHQQQGKPQQAIMCREP